MNLADLGRHWARWQPDAVALCHEGRSTSWRELDERTDRLAGGLGALGIGPGDRVAVFLHNRPEHVDTILATWKLGAIVVPVNVRAAAPEIAAVLQHSSADLVVTEAALAPALAMALEGGPLTVLLAEELDHHGRAAPPGHRGPGRPRADAGAVASLSYSSGTSGEPKGVVLTHRSWAAAAEGWAKALRLGPDDRLLLAASLAFTGGLSVLLSALWTGARFVLGPDRGHDDLLGLVEAEGVTAVLATPIVHQHLVEHPRWATADLARWRVACCGGAPAPPGLLATLAARGITTVQAYGLTECSAVATVLPLGDAARKAGSVGLPVVHTEVSIGDPEGRRCPPGEVGEVRVEGPQLMDGYWRDPEGTASALHGGWLNTGDLGYLDDEGYLYVVDRLKDMLISGGLNVFPAEIERILAALPSIVDVAVVAVAEAPWGEVPAVVAYTGGAPLTGDDVLAVCVGSLADYKVPRYLVVTDEPLPRNIGGKIRKAELRARYADLPSHAAPIR